MTIRHTFWLTLLLLAGYCSIAFAQVRTLSVDKTQFPGLGTSILQPREADGNPATREWLQLDGSGFGTVVRYRLITTAAGIWISPWFHPEGCITRPPGDFFGTLNLEWTGDRYRFVYSGQTAYQEVDLPLNYGPFAFQTCGLKP